MAPLPRNIAALIDSDKALITVPEWDEQSDPRYIKLLHPLSVAEVTVGGFVLRMKVSKRFPDRDALAQIEFAPSGRRSAIPLWRIEWRPFSSHQNGGHPAGFALRRFVGESHEHTFHDNYVAEENRMRSGNLPGAILPHRDPGTLSDFLAFCGERFRIKDIGRITLPALTADLFWAKDD